MPDVLCLRAESDIDAVGVARPMGLDILYRTPAKADVAAPMQKARALVIPAVGPALDPSLFRGTALKLVQVTGAGLDRVDQVDLADECIALDGAQPQSEVIVPPKPT